MCLGQISILEWMHYPKPENQVADSNGEAREHCYQMLRDELPR